jgi:hypothetical protein
MSGPILIFDKSALEALGHDEAIWLDNFFMCNITPLFFIETLADLEKEVRAGRTPEQVVGNIARKTPDMQSVPNTHHWQLLALELSGADKVAMDGRVTIFGGKRVQLGGSKGLIVQRNLAEEAFYRWQQGQFLDLERQIAKVWRKNASNVNYDQPYSFFQKWYPNGVKPRDLAECKQLADANIDYTDQESCLEFGLSLLRVPGPSQQDVIGYWRSLGKPPIRDFAPYFRYVFGVELFFYLAIAADLISRVRPANKADNKVDIAYLHYLPFCHVFTSNDNLHERVVPLFLRQNQTFVKGQELKADLAKLDAHYSLLPEDVKASGVYRFAASPPSDDSFLVTRLWDEHSPKWRRSQAEQKELTPELQRALLELVRRTKEESRPLDPAERLSFSETNFLQMERRIMPKKGKWVRVPPDAA